MEPLAEVWRGHYEDSGFFVHAYVLQDGRRYVDAPDPEVWQGLKDVTQLVRYSPPAIN